MPVFNVRSDEQDVDALMQRVAEGLTRSETGAWSGAPVALPAAAPGSGGEPELRQALALLNASWNIDGQAVVHSTRPRWGRQIIRFQQTVRRLSWWFTEPLLLQIRGFNGNAARTANGLYRQLNEQAARIEELTDRVAELEARLEAQRGAPRGEQDRS